GAVRVFEHEDDTMRTRFHVTAVHVHNPRRGAEKRAGYGNGFAFGHGGKLEQVGVITGGAQSALGNFQAEAFGKRRRVYFVDLAAAGALQEAFQDRARDRGRIDLVHFADVVDVQALGPSGRELEQKTWERFAETE